MSEGQSNAEAGSSGGDRLVALVHVLKEQYPNDPQVVVQCVADVNALDRDVAQRMFDARQEYARQSHDLRRVALDGLREYGLQTLKWAFILNAGAIAIVIAYIGSAIGEAGLAPFRPLLQCLLPFVVGCVLIILAGAAGFFNFSWAEGEFPGQEALHNFMSAPEQAWPLARLQNRDEDGRAFNKRLGRWLNWSRGAAIVFAALSAICFLGGVLLLLLTTVWSGT